MYATLRVAYCVQCRADWPSGVSPSTMTAAEAKVGLIDEVALSFLLDKGWIEPELAIRFHALQQKSLGITTPAIVHCKGKCNGRWLLLEDTSYPDCLRAHPPNAGCGAGEVYTHTDGVLARALAACECGATFCLQCKMPATPPHRCGALVQGQDDAKTIAEIKQMIKAGKECPACGQFIEKNQGCDHMMCGANASGSYDQVLRMVRDKSLGIR